MKKIIAMDKNGINESIVESNCYAVCNENCDEFEIEMFGKWDDQGIRIMKNKKDNLFYMISVEQQCNGQFVGEGKESPFDFEI